MRLRMVLGGTLATILTGMLATGVAQTFSPVDLSGPELFERYCAACHGTDARGTGPVAQTMSKAVPDLTVLALAAGGDFPGAAIRDAIDGRSMAISHGTRQMPVWGYEFWVEEGADIVAERNAREMINRLVAYIESLQVRQGTEGFD